MSSTSMHRFVFVAALAAGARAQAMAGPLVDARTLAAQLGAPDLLVLDASPAPVHAKAHIPGAVPVDTMALASFGARETPVEQVERRYRALGLDPSKRVVIYDTGGTWFATRVFFALQDHGFPVEKLVDPRRRTREVARGRPAADGGRHARAHARIVPHRAARRHARERARPRRRERRPRRQGARRRARARVLLRRDEVLRPRRPPAARGAAAGRGLLQRRQDLQVARRDPAAWPRSRASGPSARCSPTAAAAARPPCRTSRCASSPATRACGSRPSRSTAGCRTTASCRCGPTRRRRCCARRTGCRPGAGSRCACSGSRA